MAFWLRPLRFACSLALRPIFWCGFSSLVLIVLSRSPKTNLSRDISSVSALYKHRLLSVWPLVPILERIYLGCAKCSRT